MQQNSGSSTAQDIRRLSSNVKIYYSLHKSAPLVCVQIQIILVNLLRHIFKIHFNIIFTPTRRSCKWSLPCWFKGVNSHTNFFFYIVLSENYNFCQNVGIACVMCLLYCLRTSSVVGFYLQTSAVPGTGFCSDGSLRNWYIGSNKLHLFD
jgi:hypothetical protein